MHRQKQNNQTPLLVTEKVTRKSLSLSNMKQTPSNNIEGCSCSSWRDKLLTCSSRLHQRVFPADRSCSKSLVGYVYIISNKIITPVINNGLQRFTIDVVVLDFPKSKLFSRESELPFYIKLPSLYHSSPLLSQIQRSSLSFSSLFLVGNRKLTASLRRQLRPFSSVLRFFFFFIYINISHVGLLLLRVPR